MTLHPTKTFPLVRVVRNWYVLLVLVIVFTAGRVNAQNYYGPTVQFKYSSYSVNENVTGGKAIIEVTLSETSTQEVKVDYRTDDGTATQAGQDYVATSGTLVFPPGMLSKQFEVTIVDDSYGEFTEYLILTLSNPQNAALGVPNVADLTIFDDDIVPSVQFSVDCYSVNERELKAVITVTLTPPIANTVTVQYMTNDGSASYFGAHPDYVTASGILTFNPGHDTRTFEVQVINDEFDELEETVLLLLHSPSSNAVLGVPNLATLKIQPSPDKRGKEEEVDIDIFNGQNGKEIPEADEDAKRGAVTVANLNDTDGNGVPDVNDPIVVRAETKLTDNVAQGATILKVESVDGYRVGDIIAIGTNGPPNVFGESLKVKSVDAASKQIELEAGTKRAYDKAEPFVKVYHPGRDEQDLMKIVLRKPVPDNDGNVELWLKSGEAKIWKFPYKKDEVILTNGKVTYATNQLPLELWVEARAVSAQLRDIELRLTYGNKYDTVNATAVWVTKTVRPVAEGTNPWVNRQTKDGFPDNPVPGAKKEIGLPDLTAPVFSKLIEDIRPKDGSRYGHGIMKDHTADKLGDAYFGGRILWEFKITPLDAGKLGVVFDVTRQIQDNIYRIDAAYTAKDDPQLLASEQYPWLQSPPRDNETPNDEQGPSDGQNTPVNGLLYSV